MNKEKKIETKEKEKICPLNPVLACEDCRLFQKFLGSKDQRVCVFVRIVQRMPL